MRQAAKELKGESFGLGRRAAAAMQQQEGEHGVQELYDHLPGSRHHQRSQRARYVMPQGTQGLLNTLNCVPHVPPFAGQLTQTSADLSHGQVAFGQLGGMLIQLLRRIVLATQHQHMAQPRGDAILYRLGTACSTALGDTILLFGDFQCMLSLRLFGRLQGIRQGLYTVACRVEVVGQIRHSFRFVFAQVNGCRQMKLLPLFAGQQLQQ